MHKDFLFNIAACSHRPWPVRRHLQVPRTGVLGREGMWAWRPHNQQSTWLSQVTGGRLPGNIHLCPSPCADIITSNKRQSWIKCLGHKQIARASRSSCFRTATEQKRDTNEETCVFLKFKLWSNFFTCSSHFCVKETDFLEFTSKLVYLKSNFFWSCANTHTPVQQARIKNWLTAVTSDQINQSSASSPFEQLDRPWPPQSKSVSRKEKMRLPSFILSSSSSFFLSFAL